MAGDVPQPSYPGLNGEHEHAWRRRGRLESASDVASAERHATADERERALDLRESDLRAQESRQAERRGEVDNVLENARTGLGRPVALQG